MSRTPVREAIHRLQSDGLVIAAGRGVAVAPIYPEEIVDFYQLRAALEALAAELAAARQREGLLAPAVLRDLEARAHDVGSEAERYDVEGTVRTNLALHKAIGVAAGNRFVEEALQRLWDRIAISTVIRPPQALWGKRRIEQHTAIIAAIKAGDSQAAGDAARRHILDGLSAVRQKSRPD